MVNLKVYSFLIFRAEDLWDGDILPLSEGCRGARVRVYLLPVRLEMYGVVFDAFEELVLVCLGLLVLLRTALLDAIINAFAYLLNRARPRIRDEQQ